MKKFLGYLLTIAFLLSLVYGLPIISGEASWFLMGSICLVSSATVIGLCFLIAWLLE